MPSRRALVASLLCVAVLTPFLAPEARADKDVPVDLAAPLPTDPAIERTGTLDNGFSWWIRRHGMPAGKVTLLLHIDSGSLQEEDEQRGLAHFLEHLAFNGSEHFPPGEVVRYFESLGMTFGTHQNAFTSFDETTYILSLPDPKVPTIEKALLFLTDVAHRLTIDPEEVEKERAVILEEHRARQGVGQRVMEQALALLLPEARLAKRLPMGDLDVVRNAPPALLRSYYETWYRPDRSTLVVVGDIDPAAVEKLVRKAFTPWQAQAATPKEVDSGMSDARLLDAAVLTDPEMTDANLMLTALRPEPALATVGDYRRVLVERLGHSIFNRRLETRVQANEAAFVGGAGADSGMAIAGYLLGGVGLETTPERWAEALTQIVEEVRRVREHGIGDAELAHAKDVLASAFEQAARTAGDAPATSVATSLNEAVSRGRVPMSRAQARDLAVRLLPGISAAEVVATFAAFVDPARSLVLLMVPEREGVEIPTKEKILATLRAALETEVAKPAERTEVTTLLAQDPKPGAVASRVHNEALGVTSLKLENGIIVHVKPMPTVEEVMVRISLMGGLVEETAGTRGLTEAAAIAFEPGRQATKRHTPADVTRWLEPRPVSVSGVVEDTAVSVHVQGTPEGVPDGLRLAHLLLTEPVVDETAFQNWQRELAPKLAQLKINISTQGFFALRDVASDGDVRLTLPSDERYAALDAKAAQAWLERLVTQAPIEIVFAGGIDVAEAERLALVFFGSLPKRPDRWAEIRALRKVKVVEGPLLEDVAVETITPVAMVLLAWRGVPLDDAPRQIALTYAGTILTTRLLEVVREEKGLTYSIGSSYLFTDFEGLDALVVQFAAAPAKATEAAKVAKDVVLGLAKGGLEDDEIETAEKQMANMLDEQMQMPAFWTAVLAKTHANERTVSHIQGRLEALRSVDREMLEKTLREIVVEDRFAQVIAKPAGS